MRYKVIYTSTTLVDPYIQLPDFPRFADADGTGILASRLKLKGFKFVVEAAERTVVGSGTCAYPSVSTCEPPKSQMSGLEVNIHDPTEWSTGTILQRIHMCIPNPT